MEFKKRKIARILRLLTKQDIFNFKLFLDSPYFVKQDQSIILHKLFDCLVKRSKSLKSPELTEAYLNKKVYGTEPIVPGKIDKQIASLTQFLIQFLGVENQNQPNKCYVAALEILRKREGVGLWENLYKKIQKNYNQETLQKKKPSFELLKLELEKFEFQNLDPLKTSKESFSEILNALDNFYQDYTLDIAIQVLSHNKFIIPVELESRFEALKVLLEEEYLLDKHPEFKIKHQAFILLNNPETANKRQIENLLLLLRKYEESLHANTINNIRSIARNLAIHLYNKGQLELEKFIFNLYQEDVAVGAVYYYSKISVATINNISTFALRQKQYDWLASFLKQQKNNILEEYMADFIIHLNQAKLLFFQGKYLEVLNTIQFDVKDFYLKASARILEVMTYYELQSEQLQHKIDSYKLFIYRMPKAKVSSKFIKGHNNFVDILKNIQHPKTAYDEKRMAKITAKINATTVLAERSWLLEKIADLSAGQAGIKLSLQN